MITRETMKKVPIQFPSKTAYSPKQILFHMDDLKVVCSELQDTVIELSAKIAELEAKCNSCGTKPDKKKAD